MITVRETSIDASAHRDYREISEKKENEDPVAINLESEMAKIIRKLGRYEKLDHDKINHIEKQLEEIDKLEAKAKL